MKKSSDKTLIEALRILANDIQSDDGVANACIREAADRLQFLSMTARSVAQANIDNGLYERGKFLIERFMLDKD